jgi:hypothetical protein
MKLLIAQIIANRSDLQHMATNMKSTLLGFTRTTCHRLQFSITKDKKKEKENYPHRLINDSLRRRDVLSQSALSASQQVYQSPILQPLSRQ